MPIWCTMTAVRFASWRSIGSVNQYRLGQFRQYVGTRQPDSLPNLLCDDRRFRKPDTTLDAYAEAWALNYYLINRRQKEYVQYLQRLAERKPMIYDTPEERLAGFREAFGDPAPLDHEFLRYLTTVPSWASQRD